MGTQIPQKGAQSPPILGPWLLWQNGRPSLLLSAVALLAFGSLKVIYATHRHNKRVHSDGELISRLWKSGTQRRLQQFWFLFDYESHSRLILVLHERCNTVLCFLGMPAVLLSALCPPAPLKSLTFWCYTNQIIIIIISQHSVDFVAGQQSSGHIS